MAEVQYPSNSNKSKEQISTTQKLINGKVSGEIQKKQSNRDKFLEAMFAKDISGALKALFWTKLMPRAKGAFLSSLHDAVNSVFNWGGGNGNGQTNYNNMYNNGYPGQTVIYNGSNYQQITGTANGYPKASDLVFDDPSDAQNVLNHLKSAIEDCGYVTVNMMYGWLGRGIDYTWNNYGWTNVDNAKILQQGEKYVLKLPKASPIDNN